MGANLIDCWDEWDGPTPTVAPTVVPTVVPTDVPTLADAYAKRFNARETSARRSDVGRPGTRDLEWMMDLLEEWRDDQTRLFRIHLLVSTIGLAILLCRIRSLERKLSRR